MPNYIGLRVCVVTRSGVAVGCAGNVLVAAVGPELVILTDDKRTHLYKIPRAAIARVSLFR